MNDKRPSEVGWYHRQRAVIHRPTSRFGRWTISFTIEGDEALTLVSRSDIGLPSAWTQRGAERKAARRLRRLRRESSSYEVWCVDEKGS